MFKKKYKPSKLGEKPITIDSSDGEIDDEKVVKKSYEDFIIDVIPLKKGDDYEEEDIKQNKFSHLAVGSTELLHEKLKH